MNAGSPDQFQLRVGVVFLNFGSFGACPHSVFETYQSLQRELEAQPVEFLDQDRGIIKRLSAVRISLAAYMNASPDDIVPAANVTTALNIVAQSLDLKPGDEILTTDHEYTALVKTWEFVANRTGASVVVAKIPLPLSSGEEFTKTLLDGISERTRVLFLSHITSPTALVFPISDIVAIARERGITSLIDGAHVPGHIPLDLMALNADFYAGNCHKWLMAPKGAGFLWARKDRQPELEPLVISHGWVPSDGAPSQRGPFGNSRFIDAFELGGTRDPAAWFSVPEAIMLRKRKTIVDALETASKCAKKVGQELSEHFGTVLFAREEFLAPQMISVELPDCDVGEIKRRLWEQFRIEVPVFRWNGRALTRLSMHVFNNASDGQKLVDALNEIFFGKQK